MGDGKVSAKSKLPVDLIFSSCNRSLRVIPLESKGKDGKIKGEDAPATLNLEFEEDEPVDPPPPPPST